MDNKKNNVQRERELTYKEKRFVSEYIATAGNGAVAYARAYNRENDSTARVEASEKLKKPEIRDEIQRLAKPYLMSLEEEEKVIRKRLMSMVDGTDASASNSDIIRASDVLNRMSARYLNRTTDETNKETTISDLDSDQLMSIINENPLQ